MPQTDQERAIMANIRRNEHLPPTTSSQKAVPAAEKKRILERIKRHFDTKKLESQERDRIKDSKKQLEIAQKKKQMEKASEIMDRIRQEQILLHRLQSDKLSADQLSKLENAVEDSDDPVLPKGVLEKREDAAEDFRLKQRFGSEENRNPADEKLFPGGFQKKRKITIVDPTTGQKSTEFTSKLSEREFKNLKVKNFDSEGVPQFEAPQTEKVEQIHKQKQTHEEEIEDDEPKSSNSSQDALFVGSQGNRV